VKFVSDKFSVLEKSKMNTLIVMSEEIDLLQKDVDGNPQKGRKET
jgi:hypothetical protein